MTKYTLLYRNIPTYAEMSLSIGYLSRYELNSDIEHPLTPILALVGSATQVWPAYQLTAELAISLTKYMESHPSVKFACALFVIWKFQDGTVICGCTMLMYMHVATPKKWAAGFQLQAKRRKAAALIRHARAYLPTYAPHVFLLFFFCSFLTARETHLRPTMSLTFAADIWIFAIKKGKTTSIQTALPALYGRRRGFTKSALFICFFRTTVVGRFDTRTSHR